MLRINGNRHNADASETQPVKLRFGGKGWRSPFALTLVN